MSQEVLLERLTRREFRERLQRGELQAAIIATGSIEQHLEHLPFCHDTSMFENGVIMG
jgi:creatinine amidohydrolase/Fe(II)-dependent formamide hydrolase-like protein